jgi:hypothetical protein
VHCQISAGAPLKREGSAATNEQVGTQNPSWHDEMRADFWKDVAHAAAELRLVLEIGDPTLNGEDAG